MITPVEMWLLQDWFEALGEDAIADLERDRDEVVRSVLENI